MRSEVVTIYVNEAVFESEKEKNNGGDTGAYQQSLCRCLGVFHAEKLVLEKEEEEKVVCCNLSKHRTQQKFSRFKLEPHLKIAFKPIFSNNDLEVQWAEADGRSRKRKKHFSFLLIARIAWRRICRLVEYLMLHP